MLRPRLAVGVGARGREASADEDGEGDESILHTAQRRQFPWWVATVDCPFSSKRRSLGGPLTEWRRTRAEHISSATSWRGLQERERAPAGMRVAHDSLSLRGMRIAPKLVWVAVTVLVVAAAALDAHAITTLVGMRLAPDAHALAVASRAGDGRDVPPVPPASRSADAILARNPFDHDTSLVPAGDGPDVVATGSADLRDAPPCDGLRVVAIAASSDPEWSFAALTTTADPKGALHRRGEEVGDRKVAFVGWDRVWMQRGPALCQASLFPPKPPPTSAKELATPTVATKSSVPAAIAKGIRKNGPTDYDIDRATLDKILESQHELMAQTRVAPDTVDGRVAGLRLMGIKPDSLLGMIGLSNNDRLEAINGLDISSPEKALEAYARIRNGDRFNVRVTRDGKPMTLDYAIK